MKQGNESKGMSATINPSDRRAAGQVLDKETLLKKAEEAGRPGPGHKALEALLGSWKAEVKCYMDPDGPPQVSQATAKGNWIMNGRFLEEDFQGEMMGKPFRGRTIIGFDNVKQTFKSVWFSDAQTSLFVTEGRGEGGNKVITLEGTSNCPATGLTDEPMKVVLRFLGPDKRTFEMFDLGHGVNTKTMEITYTRAH